MTEKMGNEFPKMGNSLPITAAAFVGLSYEAAIAAAVREELGGSHQAIKTLMRRTGASARTAKNWLSGSVGPSGAHLIDLMRSSDVVFEAVLGLVGRNRDAHGRRIAEANKLLKKAALLLEG